MTYKHQEHRRPRAAGRTPLASVAVVMIAATSILGMGPGSPVQPEAAAAESPAPIDAVPAALDPSEALPAEPASQGPPPPGDAPPAAITNTDEPTASAAVPQSAGSDPLTGSQSVPEQDTARTVADLVCTPGNFYSSSSTGQLRRVNNGVVTTVGTPAAGVASFNGLGVGAGGQAVYAYERNAAANAATIWSFNTTTETWASTGRTLDTTTTANGAFNGNLVAGDVNPQGRFYFGGFQNIGNTAVFKIWSYLPSSQAFTYHGYVATGASSTPAGNGDMAFDANGNLFIVRGVGTQASVYSVTAAALAAGTGSTTTPIPGSGTNSFAALDSINGVAFDPSGRIILGNGSNATSYAMPGFTNATPVTTSLVNSTDLASCASPPTITVQKSLNGRAKPADQFTLNLSRGTTAIGSVTTAGTATGVQPQQVGPQPTTRGVELSFSETAAGGTVLSDYTTAWACRVDGATTPIASGSGTTGTVTIPAAGQSVVCQFTNTTRPATAVVNKSWVVDGQTFTHANRPTGLDATLGLNPAGTGTGTATWGQTRSGFVVGQQIGISETTSIDTAIMPGCRLTSATISGPGITGTPALGSPTTVTLPGTANEYTVTNTVTCTQSLTMTKVVENEHGGTRVAADWNNRLHADRAGQPRLSFTTGQTRQVAVGSYTLSEDQLDGYDLEQVTCQGATFNAANRTVAIARGQNATCTLTNADQAGSVVWAKTSEGGEDRLTGSVWELRGPGGSTVRIEDCVAASAQACQGPDRDPAGGSFSIPDLAWGDYQLVEITAPTGYLLDDQSRPFTISGTSREIDLGTIENEQINPPELPLTGGTGSDLFTIIGSALGLGGLLTAAILWARRNRKAA